MNEEIVATTDNVHHDDVGYEDFLAAIRKNFRDASTGNALFKTNATDLFDVFLAGLPEEVCQHYTCNACRKFVERFGHVVAIDEAGHQTPVMWPETTPALYQASVDAVRLVVEQSKVTGVFFSEGSWWGTPVTGEWHHMSVASQDSGFHSLVKTANQAMADKREDYKTLINGLVSFPAEAVVQALRVLKSDALYRSEKVLGNAEWLIGVHDLFKTKNANIRNCLIWKEVAAAPAGFCHVKSSMIGTLLEDIVAGLSFESISTRFREKMNPTQYQRPQSLPSATNVARAEEIVEKLGIARSLQRRFATIEDMDLLWKPAEKAEAEEGVPESGGVFSAVETKSNKPPIDDIDIPPSTMTWVKFRDTVLPTAEAIDYWVPTPAQNYVANVTAVNPDAPPILQWDSAQHRNPVSWYMYSHGSFADRWELAKCSYVAVTGICLKPSMWREGFDHQGKHVFFLLDGARDSGHESSGLAIFPETMKSELREIRKTIEEFSRKGTLEGFEDASACGVALRDGNVQQQRALHVKVMSNGSRQDYIIDRWD